MDYVTEKLFNILNGGRPNGLSSFGSRTNIIPVTLNGAKMPEIAPPHSHINYDSKSDSPHDFAKHLEVIAGNDTLYASYFWWRDYYEVRNSQADRAQSFCVQDLMTQTNRQKYIMICTIGGSKMLAVRNIIIDCFIR